MKGNAKIAVVIPALNEEKALGKVLSDIPDWVDDIIVADNGSTDRTPEVARKNGARVVFEPRRGYGSACLKAMSALNNPDIVVFLDGDYSDYPEEMPLLVDPILNGEADMVIGSRTIGKREAGALTLQARFGNWLSTTLIQLFWKVKYTDLGPFRTIRWSSLKRLKMRDPNYGWTVEMQIKATILGLKEIEVPVSYRKRIGKSKVSGTIKGVIGAGVKILATIFSSALKFRLPRTRTTSNEKLIVFTRYPEPGKTKTRLIPALGAEGTADLHCRMAELAARRAKWLAGSHRISIEVAYEGGDEEKMKRWLGPGPHYVHQGSGDLGRRMAQPFHRAFEAGVKRVVLFGTDSPGNTISNMRAALDALKKNDLVLGPADDGGYYLIGIRNTLSRADVNRLFSDIPWGTGKVLEKTIRATKEIGLSYGLVKTLTDIDRPEDITAAERELLSSRKSEPRISVIVPTLNEEKEIADALDSTLSGTGVEAIVVDGGSADGTPDAARAKGVKIISARACPAIQMNAGAAAATGDILLFLHADTKLPEGFDCMVRRALADPVTVGGAFKLQVAATSKAFRIIERLVNWRSRRLKMPYGDQAIFVKTDVFRRIGGFSDMPIMEDFELLQRLRRLGRVAIVPAPVLTSARRWLDLGVFRTTFVNQKIIAGYCMGISPARLAKWYNMDRKARQ